MQRPKMFQKFEKIHPYILSFGPHCVRLTLFQTKFGRTLVEDSHPLSAMKDKLLKQKETTAWPHFWNNERMAVKEGFEPSIRDKPYTPLAGERLQPLGHLTTQIRWCAREDSNLRPPGS